MAYSKCQNGSVQFFQAMEKHVLAFKEQFNSQELANILYSYGKNPNCNKELLKDLEGTVRTKVFDSKPKEVVQFLMAYTETNKMTEQLFTSFEQVFIRKFEEMNAEDISKYYYCFTKLGFKGSGIFYKHL